MAHTHAPEDPLYSDMPKGLPRDYGHVSATSLDEEQGSGWGLPAALLLALVAALSCAPIWSDPTALHLPRCSEPYDAAIYPWNFFWAMESWGADDGSPLFTKRFYYPHGESLALYTPTYLYGLLSVPFQWVFGADGLNIAVAFFLTFSTVASALLAMGIGRRLGLTLPGALVAGLLVALCAGRWMNAARLNLFCTEFLLAFLLLLIVFLQKGGWLRAVALGMAAAALLLQSQPLFFQATLAATLLLAGYLSVKLVRRMFWRKAPHWTVSADPHASSPTWKAALLAVVVFTLLGGPFLWTMAQDLLKGGPALAQWAAFIKIPDSSLDLASLIVPTEDDRIYGSWLGERERTFFEGQAAGNSVSFFLGFVWSGLVAWAIVRGRLRRWLPILLFTTGIFAIALGPTIRWMQSDVTTTSAYSLLSWFPPVQLSKSPVRLVLLVQVGLALLAGYGAQLVWAPRPESRPSIVRGVLWLCLVSGAVWETSETLPMRSIEPNRTIPAEVRALANEPGPFSVLDLPFDDPVHFGAPRIKAVSQAFGAFHQKPTYFGLFPRAQKENLAELSGTPLFVHLHACWQWAVQITLAAPGKTLADHATEPRPSPADPQAIRATLQHYDVGAVLVHDLHDLPVTYRVYVDAVRATLRSLQPTSETEVDFGPGWSLTLFRFDTGQP